MKSITHWTRRDAVRFAGRVALVASVWYVLWRGPQDGLGSLLDGGVVPWIAVVLANTLVVGYLIVRSRWAGAKLIAAVGGMFAGLQAISFLEIYLYGMVSLEDATTMAITSVATIAVVTLVAVAVFGRLRGESFPPTDDRLRLSVRQWAWKVPTIGVVHLLAFIASGVGVFLGVARLVDPVALASYEMLDAPAWVIPFQAVRGVVFAALLLPVIYQFRGGLRETRWAVSLAFAVLLSSGMALPDAGIPGRLWIAHLAEVAVSSLVLGYVVVTLVHHPHHPVRWLRARIGGGEPRPETELTID